MSTVPSGDLRVCKICGRSLPIDHFYKSKIRKDGLDSRCIPCVKATRKERDQRRKTDPTYKVLPPHPQRFWERIRRTASCWEWTAGTDFAGYGYYFLNGRLRKAHQVSYEMTVGPIPEGLELDHLCHNRLCVNPDHLEPVTHAENAKRNKGVKYRRRQRNAHR